MIHDCIIIDLSICSNHYMFHVKSISHTHQCITVHIQAALVAQNRTKTSDVPSPYKRQSMRHANRNSSDNGTPQTQVYHHRTGTEHKLDIMKLAYRCYYGSY